MDRINKKYALIAGLVILALAYMAKPEMNYAECMVKYANSKAYRQMKERMCADKASWGLF